MKKSLLTLLIGISLSFFPTITSAQAPVPYLETSGVGEVEATPDMADISIAVSLTRKTAKEAKKASDEAVSSLLQRLDKMKVARKDIKSANISLYAEYAEYDYPKDSQPKLKGYRANRNVSITIRDLNKLNSVLDGALTDGLNKINDINLRSSQEEKLKVKARNKAIEDAINKANSLARGFNQTISGVWAISYNSYSSEPYNMRATALESASNDMSYVDSKISIRDTVDVIFTINGSKVEYIPIN